MLAETELAVLEAMLRWQSAFPRQLHDAMTVASHEVNDTVAVLTSDKKVAQHVQTVWD